MRVWNTVKRLLPTSGFPTKALILIILGVAGLIVVSGVKPYLEAGTEIVNQIPDVELCALTGSEVVYMAIDLRPQWNYVCIRDINASALIYVYWDVEAGWLRPVPGDRLLGVEGYIYDENNFTRFQTGQEADYISYGTLDVVGQMYGVAPADGDYYVVFDNSEETWKNMAYKTIHYNIRSYVPAHEERVSKEGPKSITTGMYVLCIGLIGIGALDYIYLKWKK